MSLLSCRNVTLISFEGTSHKCFVHPTLTNCSNQENGALSKEIHSWYCLRQPRCNEWDEGKLPRPPLCPYCLQFVRELTHLPAATLRIVVPEPLHGSTAELTLLMRLQVSWLWAWETWHFLISHMAVWVWERCPPPINACCRCLRQVGEQVLRSEGRRAATARY